MDAKKIVEKLKQNYNLQEKYDIAFIMGSGLDKGVPKFEDELVVDYCLTDMPKSKVQGFTGRFVFGKLFGKNVMKITRYHYYEEGSLELVRLPFEILSLFNVETVIMATATGGVDPSFNVGDLMLIEDHINFAGNSPLIGMDEIVFVDLNNAYDKNLRELALKASKECGIELKRGVHMQFCGPTYETPAEIKMARLFGASTVSMSTVFDTICARYFKMRVLAFASITDMPGVSDEVITHEMVLETSRKNAEKLSKIISKVLNYI